MGWDEDSHPGRDGRVDENPRSVRPKPIVLEPRLRIRGLLDRTNTGRQVQDSIDVAHRVGYRGRIEEVQLLASGHRDLMARSLGEGPQRSAEHASTPGGEQPQP